MRDEPFQFHKGTIRTDDAAEGMITFLRFQFHKGTIRTFLLRCEEIQKQYFNSIKVRLER